jgi:hypothetical protein
VLDKRHPLACIEVVLIHNAALIKAEQIVLGRTDLDQLGHRLLDHVTTPSALAATLNAA